MSPSRARLVLGAIATVAALELVASAHVYRDRLDDDDWAAARDAVAAVPKGEAVALATPWLGPSARMQIPALASVDAVARPDLHGVARLHVLGLDAAWSEELDDDLDGAPRPEPVSTIDAGPFTLTTYELGSRRVLADWARPGTRLSVETEAPCRGGDPFRCVEGSVGAELAEIDYRPRACLSFAIADGIAAHVRHDRMPLGDVLRGHVGFHDYNGRLRSDSPARVVVRIDDAVVARFVVTDAEGWRAFEIPTAPGSSDVEVEVTVGVLGTWGKHGIDNVYPRRACLELRSLQEGG